ncbi:MAG: hypothetical protein L0H70_05100, partial [Xanthomonadales bacterium]|nr:hypothetical protein [Xanthomonadales bacterium]
RIDDRFAMLMEEARAWRKTERNLADLRAHVGEHYMRREDYFRNQSVMEAKLDALADKLERLQQNSQRGSSTSTMQRFAASKFAGCLSSR